MYGGQQNLQSAVSRVQNEISALVAGLENGHDCKLKRQDNIYERMLLLERVHSGQVKHSKNTMNEKTVQTVVVYTNGWQNHLMELGKLITTSLIAPLSLTRTASNACSATEPKTSNGRSGGFASSFL